jgi:hypothetical protein
MYRIERTHYGLRVTMGNLYSTEEIKKYIAEKEALVAKIEGPFSLLADLRSAIPPDENDEALLAESQARMKLCDLRRMAIIVTSPVIKTQARQISYTAGIDDRTRIINASKSPNWEELAIQWIVCGTEPETAADLGQRLKQPI